MEAGVRSRSRHSMMGRGNGEMEVGILGSVLLSQGCQLKVNRNLDLLKNLLKTSKIIRVIKTIKLGSLEPKCSEIKYKSAAADPPLISYPKEYVH